MPRKTRPSSPGPDSSPAQPATGPTPTPPPPTSPTISTVRRDPTTGNLLLATSDPRSTFRSTKLVVDTINLTNPVHHAVGVGFVYASEWDRCEPVTDYTLLPRTLHQTRLFTPPLRSDLSHLQWQAISNPWFLADGVAIVRITPVSCDDPTVKVATTCTLAEWLSVPEVLAPRDPAITDKGFIVPPNKYIRNPEPVFTPVCYDEVFLRLLAASITGHSTQETCTIPREGETTLPGTGGKTLTQERRNLISYHIELAADLTAAALTHLASRKDPSCKSDSTPSSTTSPTPSSPGPK